MTNKKILIFGVALILLALIAGMAFAESNINGVYWVVIKGNSTRVGEGASGHYMEIYNSNNYAVRVTRRIGNGSSITEQHDVGANETIHVRCWPDSSLTSVVKR